MAGGMEQKAKGYALVLTSALMWGAIPLFTRYLYATGLGPLDVASVRSYLAAGMSVVLLLALGDLRNFKPRDLPFYILYSLLAMSGTFIAYASAVEQLPIAMASVLLYTAPVFVNVLNRVLYQVPFTREKVFSLVLTLAGCALVVRMYDPASLRGEAPGILLGIAAGLCYSMTTVMGTKALEKNPSRCNGLLTLALSFLPFLAVRPPAVVAQLEPLQLLFAVGLSIVCTVVPYLLYQVGLGCGIDGGNASIAATAEIVAATTYNVVAFGDVVEPLQVLGMAIVFAGVALPIVLSRVAHARDEVPEPAPVRVTARQ